MSLTIISGSSIGVSPLFLGDNNDSIGNSGGSGDVADAALLDGTVPWLPTWGADVNGVGGYTQRSI